MADQNEYNVAIGDEYIHERGMEFSRNMNGDNESEYTHLRESKNSDAKQKDNSITLGNENTNRGHQKPATSFESKPYNPIEIINVNDQLNNRPNSTSLNQQIIGSSQSNEITELFNYIEQYKPPIMMIETKLKPFIPDFVSSIGIVDSFIKVPRPDGVPESLGMLALDEPTCLQTDPTVLELQLISISKKRNNGPALVRSIENADKHPERIQQWINMIIDMHSNKPATQVHYIKQMPDIEILMEQMSPFLEDKLNEISLPSDDIDLTLEELSRTILSLLDIPIYDGEDNSVVHSLHVLFTLYSAYLDIPHFMEMKPKIDDSR